MTRNVRFGDDELRELVIHETLMDKLENEDRAVEFEKRLDFLLMIAQGMHESLDQKVNLEELLQIAQPQYRQAC
jgi:hypothetical protein